MEIMLTHSPFAAAEGGGGADPRQGPGRSLSASTSSSKTGAAAGPGIIPHGIGQGAACATENASDSDPALAATQPVDFCPPSPADAELAGAKAALASSEASLAALRIQIEEEDAVAVREASSGRSEGRIDPRFGIECAALIRMTSKPFADLPRVLQRRVVEAALRIRLNESEAAASRDAKRVKMAEAGVAAEASEHNAGQPIVLLPDVLQRKIIDLLPVGR